MGIGNSKSLRSDESPLPGLSAAERLIIHAVLAGPPMSRTEFPEGPPALSETG